MKKILSLLLIMIFAVGMLVSVKTTEVHAANGVVMTVNGVEYTDFMQGWQYAVSTAKTNTPVLVKLYADWLPNMADKSYQYVNPDSPFDMELGTKQGSLCVEKGNITINLNGYSINRGLESKAYDGQVMSAFDCTLTIKDTSAAQTGKITGGYSSGSSGGGIYVGSGANLIFQSGSICGNKVASSMTGAGVFVAEDGCFTMNGGKVYGNHSEANGGGVAVGKKGKFVMNMGRIFDNVASNGYGGGVSVGQEAKMTMNGGSISGNDAQRGGGVYLGINAILDMTDGSISKNTALHGGGIYSYTVWKTPTDINGGNLWLSGGSITNNVATVGNGGAILWDSNNPMILIDCEITGNSAVNGLGGGIYVDDYANEFYVGGTVRITDNTANTGNPKHDTSNIYLSYDDNKIYNAMGQDENIPTKPLEDGAQIGLQAVYGFYSQKESLVEENSRLTSDCKDYFVSDNPAYDFEWSEGGVYIVDAVNPDEEYAVMQVTSNGITTPYFDFGRGWFESLQKSKSNATTIKLLDNWIAPMGSFNYADEDFGEITDSGVLCIEDSSTNLTIDLNGYTISRNLETAVSDGQVFLISDGMLTVTDTSDAQTGKITGANNTGDGGAFYVDYGKLYIKGGNIVGNQAKYGGAIYCDDQDDAFVYIEGGKISGNTASANGGGIYMENGYLYVNDGEISGNKAVEGAGIYWVSDNAGCFIGGKITGNTATNAGGGVYVTSYGKVYLGGKIQITENTNKNLYLAEKSSDISNAAGQSDKIPNKPLTEGAKIGILAKNVEDLISEDDSRFNEGDFRFMQSDSSSYFIRSVYAANDKDHTHKLYFNTWSHADTRYPGIKKVNIVNGNILEDASIDYETQVITLTASVDVKASLESVPLDRLISCEFNDDGVAIADSGTSRDMRSTQEYKIMSDNGTYVMCIVKVKWICKQHQDLDGNYICDHCEEYTLTDFVITNYNVDSKEATVFVTNSGRYTLIFADYESSSLEKVDIVEYDFVTGVNTVAQNDQTFVLASGDKVMLWSDFDGLVSVCNALVIE